LSDEQPAAGERPESDDADRDARDLPDEVVPGPMEIEEPSGPGQYRKVRAPSSLPPDEEAAADEPMTAVVEVTEPGYRPSGVDIRGFITDTLLTGWIRPSALGSLDQDPRVASIELGSQTDQID
jgi:hypothetical protein